MNTMTTLALICASIAVSLAQSSGGGSKQPATDILQCISCNSAIVGQEWCASSAGVEEKKATASISCDQSPVDGEVVVGCRKTLQYVEAAHDGEERVIRECAYTGANVDGQKRTGNKGVRMYYYQCDDGNNCNGASGVIATVSVLAVGAMLTVL